MANTRMFVTLWSAHMQVHASVICPYTRHLTPFLLSTRLLAQSFVQKWSTSGNAYFQTIGFRKISTGHFHLQYTRSSLGSRTAPRGVNVSPRLEMFVHRRCERWRERECGGGGLKRARTASSCEQNKSALSIAFNFFFKPCGRKKARLTIPVIRVCAVTPELVRAKAT